MNRYKLTVAGIDPNDGIKRFSGNTEKYEEFLKKYLDDGHYTELCEAIRKKNVTEAFAAAHALKGIAANISLAGLYADIQPLVEELRNGSMEHADELLQKVTSDHIAVIAALREM